MLHGFMMGAVSKAGGAGLDTGTYRTEISCDYSHVNLLDSIFYTFLRISKIQTK